MIFVEFKVGDVVRNVFVPSLIGTVVEVRRNEVTKLKTENKSEVTNVVEVRCNEVIKVKIGDRPAVMDICACWELIKPMEAKGD